MKVLTLIYDGFTEYEYSFVIYALQAAGIEFEVVGAEGKVIHSHLGLEVTAPRTLPEIKNFAEYDALFLPGFHKDFKGISNNTQIQELVRWMNARNKIIAAVCGAPMILAKAGALNGRIFTSTIQDHPSFRGARRVDDPVARHNNLVTGQDRGFITFTALFLEALGHAAAAHKLLEYYMVPKEMGPHA